MKKLISPAIILFLFVISYSLMENGEFLKAVIAVFVTAIYSLLYIMNMIPTEDSAEEVDEENKILPDIAFMKSEEEFEFICPEKWASRVTAKEIEIATRMIKTAEHPEWN